MIVRTYGRRNRGSLSDTMSDHSFKESSLSSSQQDFYNFSSQESTSLWPPFDLDPDPYDVVVPPKSKKPRKNAKTNFSNSGSFMPMTSSTTLMEAQEFGEMMEHVDEVNFALDGLKKGQPLRIRRASLLSVLSICGTVQQRRLLRTQGMAKTIIDAVLGLSLDDSSSNLAAATLFYVLTNDGQDEHILESPSCIRFLIKLLKPIVSTASEDKARNLGSKLLALRKDADILRTTSKLEDSSSGAIVAKVQEILTSCKDLKLNCGDNSGKERPELSPKWIALLTVEKACLSKISLEDTTGTVRKSGGNFKEKFRELGGLDAVFEVAVNCHSLMEGWTDLSLHSMKDAKSEMHLQSLVLLLKCLKIMENATFLSTDNQTHLLGMKGKLDSYGCRLSFTEVTLSVIKILSSLQLLKSSSAASSGRRPCSLSDGTDRTSDFALISDHKVDSDEVICISSSTSFERTSSFKSFNTSQKSTACVGLTASSSETTTTILNDTCQLKMRLNSSSSTSCSQTLRSSNNGAHAATSGFPEMSDNVDRSNYIRDVMCELLEDSQDPFAFDEDDFQPSKWDLLSGKRKTSRTRNRGVTSRELEDGCQYQLMSQEGSSNGENCQPKSSNGEYQHQSQKRMDSNAADEEHCSLLEDCLLTAIKVLMNLTNDNPIGCQQIAACGGLESMTSLIVCHFPSFTSLSLFSKLKEDTSSIELEHHNDAHLSDIELDLLVAILGLLVNLVEKDEQNRSRLALASVLIPGSDGLEDDCHRGVIPLLCSIFLANQGAGDPSGEGSIAPWNAEEAVLEGEKEAEKMIVEAYAALLLAFLSTDSKSIRDSIAECLPNQNLGTLVPVLERFLAFHLTLNMIPPETHKAVSEVIESCRVR